MKFYLRCGWFDSLGKSVFLLSQKCFGYRAVWFTRGYKKSTEVCVLTLQMLPIINVTNYQLKSIIIEVDSWYRDAKIFIIWWHFPHVRLPFSISEGAQRKHFDQHARYRKFFSASIVILGTDIYTKLEYRYLNMNKIKKKRCLSYLDKLDHTIFIKAQLCGNS